MTVTDALPNSVPGAPVDVDDLQVIRSAPSERPRVLSSRESGETTTIVGSLVSSLAVVWLVYFEILPLSGKIGFIVCWFITYLAVFAGVSSLSNPRPIVIDRLATAVVIGASLVVGLALVTTVFDTFHLGWPALHHWNFYTKDMAGVGPQDPLNRGGVLHAIVGSLIELGIAVCVALPLGIGTAVFMVEVGGKFSIVVRTVVEAMTALPDILAGLFIYTTLIVGLGFARTGFAAACALSVMMLPIIARSADVALRVVPGGLREAAQALGASQWQTVWRVVLPTSRSGLATAVILGLARAVGETAPVLITSGASTFLNVHPLRNPMNSLPLFIFTAVRSGEPTYISRGYGAASVLLTLVLILFAAARFLSRDRKARR